MLERLIRERKPNVGPRLIVWLAGRGTQKENSAGIKYVVLVLDGISLYMCLGLPLCDGLSSPLCKAKSVAGPKEGFKVPGR
jgi:hypothetical protein